MSAALADSWGRGENDEGRLVKSQAAGVFSGEMIVRLCMTCAFNTCEVESPYNLKKTNKSKCINNITLGTETD